MTARRAVALLAALTVLAGCDASGPAAGPAAGPTAAAPAGTAGPAGGSADTAPSCPPDSRYADVMAAGGELAGTPGVLWGLLFLRDDRISWGEQVKIALRVTGSGELTLRADGPDGATVEPVGYDPHSGSDWARPGDEWGSYWVFPTPGCWTIRAARGDGTRGALTVRAG